MARTMPPLRLPCCQPRCPMEVGEREAGMYDQYFHHGECGCCFHRAPLPVVALLRGAATRSNRQRRSGPHPWWTPWHTVSDARPPHERVRWDGTTASATRSGFATTPLASGACGWALPMTRRRGRAMSSEHPHPGLRPHLADVRGRLPLDRPRARRFRAQILRKYACALGHAASLARVT